MLRRDIGVARQVVLLGCLLSFVLSGCSIDNRTDSTLKLRGVWMQGRSTRAPEQVDEAVARAEAGRFNTILAGSFGGGYANYESAIVEKNPAIESDYDPLGYVIDQAHQRGIAVHAWLAVGRVQYRGGPGPILTEHPDWAMVGPDGRQTYWLNYNRPDVRQFISDLAVEIVSNYDVDGIHLDYIRYPGSEWGFDDYSVKVAAEEYGLDLELLRYSELPAYATFEGNPLAGVNTAQPLAVFDDGSPAVLLNNYGAGKVILLNWKASDRQVAVSSELLDRSINFLVEANGAVHILRSEINASQYGTDGLDKAVAWLEDLGRQPIEVTEDDLPSLGARDVLVLPNVYLIDDQVASDLADFVHRGGGVIFIDGPTPSIKDENVQAITGMRTRGRYFEKTSLLVAKQDHEIIPNSNRALTFEDYQAMDAQWKTFRKEVINTLLQEVYQRIKQEDPDVLMTITVSGDQDELAEQHLLDWETWLDGGYVDLIIPRAYVDEDEPLAPVLANWQPTMKSSDRIALGLKAYSSQNDESIPKTPDRVLGEIELARTSGSDSIILFDMRNISDDILAALASGPFSSSNADSD